MKYLFDKSRYIIVFSCVISMLSIILSIDLYTSYKNSETQANFLSGNYSIFSCDNILEFIDETDKYTKDYMILKNSNTNVLGVYCTGTRFHPQMVEGRNISKEDYQKGNSVVIVSEDLKKDCYEKDGKIYYIFNSNSYEVIGIFKKDKQNQINQNADAYYSLLAGQNANGLTTLDSMGEYIFDAGKDTGKIQNLISEKLNILMKKGNTTSAGDRIKNVIVSKQTTWSSLVLIIAMAFLNSIGMILHWFEGRKKELKVRYMCGATYQKIRNMLLKEYFGISNICFFSTSLLLLLICATSGRVPAATAITAMGISYMFLFFLYVASLLFIAQKTKLYVYHTL